MEIYILHFFFLWRLVFTNNGAVIGVVTRVIQSSENQINGVGSRTSIPLMTCGPSETKVVGIGKQKNKLIKMFASRLCDWLLLPLLFVLWRSSFHCIILKGRKKRNVVISHLWFPRAYGSAHDPDLRFLLGLKSIYDSDYDSVANENEMWASL